MRTKVRLIFFIGVALFACSCTIRHPVAEDYPQYLAKNGGSANLPRTDGASLYFITPNTERFSYEFRAFTTGAANLWVVEFGKMLDDTLTSPEVQEAFGSLKKTSEATGELGKTLIFDLQQYTFQDYGAHISLKVTLMPSGQAPFEKIYTQDGKSQGGKMFWGGAFAQKNAVQQSTKLALDEILRDLLADLNALP